VTTAPFSSTTLPFFIFGSANAWPMIFEPTSRPPTWICCPSALPGKATWPTPVIRSG
jgi:hypothetical protein